MKASLLKTSTLCLALLLALAGGEVGLAEGQPQASFARQLASARDDYFKDLGGDRSAHEQAREKFAALVTQQPGDAVVRAYLGSLDLLDAARTWAFWNKHVLSQQGLREMDEAVNQDPSNVEARFIRAATTWHLPFFFHRRDQAEADFALIAPRAAEAVAKGTLPPQLGAAALDYYGQVLSDKSNHQAARSAFAAAVRIDESSPGGRDASRRLKQTD